MRPTQYVNRNIMATRWLSLAAFFPLVIMLFVFAGTIVSGETTLDEWKTPFLGVCMLSFGGFFVATLLEKGLLWWERRAIQRVYDEAWVKWPKRSDEKRWQQYVEKRYQEEKADVQFSFIPIIIVGVILTVIGVFFTISEGDISIIFALAGFMVIVSAIVVAEWLSHKVEIETRYKRRKNSPPPSKLISPHGHYDEDEGFDSLRALEKVEYKAAKKSGQALITFFIHARWWEGWMGSDYYHQGTRWAVRVRVPKGYEEEAEALVERFRAEVIKPRRWWERF